MNSWRRCRAPRGRAFGRSQPAWRGRPGFLTRQLALCDLSLLDALSRLGEAGLVFSRGSSPYATYLFKHALVRDAAYGKGELRLASKEPDDKRAEVSFRNAIAIARRQGAKSFELRAATSLARLLARQARREEARALLAPVYGWFTEGFDTKGLKDAKALLGELACAETPARISALWLVRISIGRGQEYLLRVES